MVDVGAYVEASTDTIITIGNIDRTHACISLVPSGNRQGSVNCFDLDTDQVVVRRTVKQIIWPYRLLRKANAWSKKGKNAILKGQINFLNRKWEKFDCENDDLTAIEMVEKTCSRSRRTFFLHSLSFECTSKLCITYLNQFSVYFLI